MFEKAKLKMQQMVARKMMDKQGIPKAQQDKLFEMMEKDPELFEKIAEEIKQLQKQGKNQQSATLRVMQKYQDRLRRLAE